MMYFEMACAHSAQVPCKNCLLIVTNGIQLCIYSVRRCNNTMLPSKCCAATTSFPSDFISGSKTSLCQIAQDRAASCTSSLLPKSRSPWQSRTSPAHEITLSAASHVSRCGICSFHTCTCLRRSHTYSSNFQPPPHTAVSCWRTRAQSGANSCFDPAPSYFCTHFLAESRRQPPVPCSCPTP